MATIQRFEDIVAWQRARTLTRRVYELTATGPLYKDRALREQMRRCSVSIMSNIAEGFERDGTQELKQFLSIAKGSAGELRAQLYVALDAKPIDEAQFEELTNLALEVSQLLAKFMKYLMNTEYRGAKHRQ